MGSLVRRDRESCECYYSGCRQYHRCIRHLGGKCVRLGGDEIPKERTMDDAICPRRISVTS